MKVRKDVFPDTRGGLRSREPRPSGESIPPLFLVFTDLDGTLLDHDTYEWEAAVPALEQCKKKGIPVILVSSKTRAEIEVLRCRMGLSAPFISENGGGIFFPRETFADPPPEAFPAGNTPSPFKPGGRGIESPADAGLWQISLGVSYPCLVKALKAIRRELNRNIRGFSDMAVEEIARLTGLNKEEARWAAMREYDEPFIIEAGEPDDLVPLHRAAGKRGLLITAGGRFYHLQGKNDKAAAMEWVAAWYRTGHGDVTSIALGDSPNDFAMLERADIPVLIRSQHTFPDLKQRIPRLRISEQSGPAGWNAALLSILSQNGEKVHEPGV